MEESAAIKRKQREFPLASVNELSSSPSSASPGVLRLTADTLQIHHDSHQIAFDVHLPLLQIFRLGPVQSVCTVEGSDAGKQTSYSRGVSIQFRNEEESEAFHCVFQQWKKEFNVQGGNIPNGANVMASKSKFDEKFHSQTTLNQTHQNQIHQVSIFSI